MAGRIKKEIEECQKNHRLTGITVHTIINGDYTHLQGIISGPSGTSYDRGIFKLDIVIPSNYPFEPPKIKFDTKIWHPNISSQTGAICLDILKDQWSPALTINTALLSIQALLSSPEPDDPQDAQVAKMYKEQHDVFLNTAKFWTETYAYPQTKDKFEEKVKRITDMGFSSTKVIEALQKVNGDENAAIDTLLNSL